MSIALQKASQQRCWVAPQAESGRLAYSSAMFICQSEKGNPGAKLAQNKPHYSDCAKGRKTRRIMHSGLTY